MNKNEVFKFFLYIRELLTFQRLVFLVLTNFLLIYILTKCSKSSLANDFKLDLADQGAFISKNITNNYDTYVTIISIYFPLAKSKHTQEEYKNWINNMLQSATKAPLVIFTDSNSSKLISQLRSNKHYPNNSIKFYIYDNIWEVMKEVEHERNKSYSDNYLFKQNNIDPEKYIHNPYLYAVWNLKSYICKQVVRMNPFNSSFFIYTDMGAWRNGLISDWPDNIFIKSLHKILNNKILFGQINEVDENEVSGVVSEIDIIEGTFFSGSSIAIENTYNQFFKLHDQRLDEGLFIGKDQIIMNIMAFDTFKNEIVRLRTWEDSNCNQSYDRWFFYQYYFAVLDKYICNNNKFSLLTIPKEILE